MSAGPETTLIDIATLAQWGSPVRVNTRHGERNVRKAKAPADFKDLWLANKAALKEAGISLGDRPGNIVNFLILRVVEAAR